MKNYIRSILYPYFLDAAALASIVGLVTAFSSDTNAIIIALITSCIILVIILIAVMCAINKNIVRCNPEEYRKISSFYNFRCDDGVHSTFEVYRLIQCKRPVLSQIEYKYKWTGSIPPKMTSESQTLIQLAQNKDASKYDTALIKFSKPLTYNESTVIHVKTENDDSDGVACPFLECKLDSPIEMMQFRILLGYKPDNFTTCAVLKRKAIHSEIASDFEIMGSVSFDREYKQYSHVMIRPDAGYIYRIEWVK